MSDLAGTSAESIASACGENVAAIAECLNQCFDDSSHELQVGELSQWSAEEPPTGFAGSGLIVACQVGEETLLCAIPQALPLPAWYRQPGDSEQARLDTLAMEWSMNLLPPELECTKFTTTLCADLQESLKQCEPADDAHLLPLSVDEDASQLWLVWPVAKLPVAEETETEVVAEAAPAPPVQAAAPVASPQPPAARPPAQHDHFARIRSITVPVIVKLAERRIEVSELLSLCPGSIIAFDKPCENLLELLVNDKVYGRGEAIKIGEKFGLKISEIGYVPQREPKVLS